MSRARTVLTLTPSDFVPRSRIATRKPQRRNPRASGSQAGKPSGSVQGTSRRRNFKVPGSQGGKSYGGTNNSPGMETDNRAGQLATTNEPEVKEPCIFLTVDPSPRKVKSRSRIVDRGLDDKETFKSLRSTYRSLKNGWLWEPVGVKFYKVMLYLALKLLKRDVKGKGDKD